VDWNGDGLQDALVAADIQGCRVYLGLPAGGFAALPEITTFGCWNMIPDMNGDGQADVIQTSLGSGFTVHLSQPDHHRIADPGSSVSTPFIVRLWVVDVDGDGLGEVVSLPGDSQETGEVFARAANGTWSRSSTFLCPVCTPNPIVVVTDLDGDGREGLLVTGQNAQGIDQRLGVFEGTAGGMLELVADIPREWPQGVKVADVDQDGHFDVVVTLGDLAVSPASGLEVLWGDGSGGLVVGNTYFNAQHGSRITSVSDVDEDGSLDIVVAGVAGGMAYLSAAPRYPYGPLANTTNFTSQAVLVRTWPPKTGPLETGFWQNDEEARTRPPAHGRHEGRRQQRARGGPAR
jgi:hypothetical protein